MIDLPWTTLLCSALTVIGAYTVYGLTGFGAVIVAVPLLAHFFSLRFAVPLVLIFDLFAGALLGLRHRKQIDRRELLRLMPYLLVGMLGGVTLLVKADEGALLLVLGLFALGYSAWSLLNRSAPQPVGAGWAAPTGLVGGAFTALYGTGGPLYAIYLARRQPDKDVLRATMGVLIFITAVLRLGLFTGSGFYTQPGLIALGLLLLPCALLGYVLGSRLHARLPAARAIQAVWWLLILSGSSLVWRSLGLLLA